MTENTEHPTTDHEPEEHCHSEDLVPVEDLTIGTVALLQETIMQMDHLGGFNIEQLGKVYQIILEHMAGLLELHTPASLDVFQQILANAGEYAASGVDMPTDVPY